MSKISSTQDSRSELQDAIRKLEAFSRHALQADAPTQISKTISLMRTLLRHAFDKPDKKETNAEKIPNCEEVLQAVEVINRERLHIQRLQKGDSAEQKLADSFTKAVEDYNACRDRYVNFATSPNKGWAKLFSKNDAGSKSLPKIDLPQKLTVQYLFSSSEAAQTAELRSEQKISNAAFLPKQSAELFQMKVLALLERYGIAESHEVRNLVKKTPIHTEIESASSRCTLKQTLSLFPGQTVVVMGTSALDPKTQSIHRLFPETFSVSLKSTQTGFPDPSQRTGWALANELIPDCPQRIDLLASLTHFFQRKREVVTGLLPNGPLVSHAKKLIHFKKQAFDLHKQELIELHKQLAHTIIRSAPPSLIIPNAENIIDQFYHALLAQQNPFEKLCEVNQLIRDLFIRKTHQDLLDMVLKSENKEISRLKVAKESVDLSIKEIQKELAQQREQALDDHERLKWNYILCLGTPIGEASKNIMLQYLSEDFSFKPPALSLFESKIQATAYQHVSHFLDELTLSTKDLSQESAHQILKKELLSDIEIFLKENIPLSKEISDYFHQRYEPTLSPFHRRDHRDK